MTDEMFDCLTGEKVVPRGKDVVYYASLFLDDGEDWSRVDSDWATMLRMIEDGANVVGFVFDVCHGRGQSSLARDYERRIRRRVEKHFADPPLETVRISVKSRP